VSLLARRDVLVPAWAMDETNGARMVGVQRIAPDGSKRFNAGMAKEGAACRLGAAFEDGDAILVCEGYATGLSIRAAVERMLPVFVAFDAGNSAPGRADAALALSVVADHLLRRRRLEDRRSERARRLILAS
jgi:phage/plasmid primase-like uncharacterized protein